MEQQPDLNQMSSHEVAADEPVSLAERIESDPEFVQEFLSDYSERHLRQESPTEAERLERVNELMKPELQTYLDAVKTPSRQRSFSGLMADVKREYSSDYEGAYLGAIAKFVKGVTVEERYKLDQVLASAVTKSQEDGLAEPIIVSKTSRKKHHGDGGEYEISYDQHGQAYFYSPDQSYVSEVIKTYQDYFNLPRYVEATNYNLDYQGKLKESQYGRMRMLLETSGYIDQEKLKPEDCDFIDPLPVNDATKSCASAMVFNLLTGCEDDSISHEGGTNKNHIQRLDGTYYLLDVSSVGASENSEVDVTKVPRQMERLESFLVSVDETELNDLIDFIADTVMMSAIAPQEKIAAIDPDKTSHISMRRYEETASKALAFPEVFAMWVDKYISDPKLKEKLVSAVGSR